MKGPVSPDKDVWHDVWEMMVREIRRGEEGEGVIIHLLAVKDRGGINCRLCTVSLFDRVSGLDVPC